MAMSSLLRKSFGAILTPTLIRTGSLVVLMSFVKSNKHYSILACFKKLASDFMNLHTFTIEHVPDRRLKPALSVHMPKPPAGFPFEIQDTPGEDTLILTRELPREKVFVGVDWKYIPYPSYIRIFQPYTDYASFHNLQLRIDVINSESNELVVLCDGTPCYFDYLDNPIKFDKCMDHHMINYWQEVLPIVGIDDAVMRFLLAYMSKRNSLNRLPHLSKMRTLLSTNKESI